MSLILPKTCSMGGSQTGLVGTIGLTLLNPDGTTHTARATANIYEIGGGCYGKNITFPDDWKGSLKWDSGGGSPVYASEDYEIEGLIQEIRTQTDKMNFTGTDIKATLDSEEVTTDTASRTASKATGFATLNPPSQNLADYKADVTNLDTTISSRSSHSAANVWTAGSRALSTPNDYKADVSTLATSTALSTHDTKLDTVKKIVKINQALIV